MTSLYCIEDALIISVVFVLLAGCLLCCIFNCSLSSLGKMTNHGSHKLCKC